MLWSCKPPTSLTFSSILCLNVGGLSPHNNLWTFFTNYFMVGSYWLGRDNRLCVILDSISVLSRVILPYGVRFLGSQRAIILSILINFFSIISVISFILLSLTVIPSDSNSDVHIRSLLLYDFILLFLKPLI